VHQRIQSRGIWLGLCKLPINDEDGLTQGDCRYLPRLRQWKQRIRARLGFAARSLLTGFAAASPRREPATSRAIHRPWRFTSRSITKRIISTTAG